MRKISVEELLAEYSNGRRDFKETDLSQANLFECDLQDIDLQGSDLRQAGIFALCQLEPSQFGKCAISRR
jgi:uncharacterized protein YjbI with pentapeptide repeats